MQRVDSIAFFRSPNKFVKVGSKPLEVVLVVIVVKSASFEPRASCNYYYYLLILFPFRNFRFPMPGRLAEVGLCSFIGLRAKEEKSWLDRYST